MPSPKLAREGADLAADDPVSQIIGVSPAVAHVRRMLTLAARSHVNVVITGETGTGKELVARAIHRQRETPSGAFIAHNCALSSIELFDSEFFGHRRGAFTGADRDRAGIVRLADGGCLFLDELECLSMANQAKLLRLLDTGEFRAVGSERVQIASVRYLAATNVHPEVMLAEQSLRSDLYYRLCGLRIDIPPLRARPGDIALLIEHFLAGTGKHVSTQAMRTLVNQAWPGNVRQLKSAIRCAALVADGPTIETCDLLLEPEALAPAASDAISNRGRHVATAGAPTARSLHEAERHTIVQSLQLHAGNRQRTAMALGIHRSTLRRKLREHGL
jgi:two-component system NtrC family response regulator